MEYDKEFEEKNKGEIIEENKIIIPKLSESGIKFIFLFEKNLCCIFFFLFLLMFIVYPSEKFLIKLCNYNCFVLLDRISFSSFCTFNFLIQASFCYFYLDFKIMLTNFFLNTLGIFILLIILNVAFVSIFELPLRVVIKSWMNKGFIKEFKTYYNTGGSFSLSSRTTLSFK